jgi:hypothetical protein
MAYLKIISSTFSLFVAIAVGFFAGKKDFLTESSTTELSRFVIRILFPIYLFRSAVTYINKENFLSAPLYTFLNVIVMIAMWFISRQIVKKANISPDRIPMFEFTSLAGNTGFFGLTFATLLFGSEEIMAAILYDFGGSLVIFLILVPFLLDNNHIHHPINFLKEPNVIAILSGLILGILGVKIPEFLAPSFNLLSQITLPLALILCGAQLASIKISKEFHFSQVLYVILIKMILMPLLLFVIVLWIPLDGQMKQFLVVDAALPSGISMVNFAKTYHQDSDFAAVAVFATTAFSVIWLPFLLIVLSSIF